MRLSALPQKRSLTKNSDFPIRYLTSFGIEDYSLYNCELKEKEKFLSPWAAVLLTKLLLAIVKIIPVFFFLFSLWAPNIFIPFLLLLLWVLFFWN
jgi:fatty acid desaturase